MKNILSGFSILIVFWVLTGCSFSGWSTYTNTAYGFQLQYPPGGSIVAGATDIAIRVQLPITSGTNLAEKYLDIDVQPGVPTCESPQAVGYAPGFLTPVTVTINGLTWVRENTSEGAAGSIYDWTAYSTVSGSVCVSLTFVLHSHNPGMYPYPPPAFDRNAESAVFIQIVDTFQWLGGGAITPTAGGSGGLILYPPIPVQILKPSDTPVSPVHILLPSATPISPVHVLLPSDTPSPSPLIFTPQVSPLEFNYQVQTVLGACRTDVPQVDISVGVSDPSAVHGVVLFFRLKNKATGAETPWNDGVIMNLQGNGKYDSSLSANQIPNVTAISGGGASAWLEYQFVATDLLGSTIGRSQVYSDVSLTPCK